jgi:hypothetical protein
MLTDLQNTNKIIQPMGLLQLGLPQPTMIPLSWKLIFIDLKDCFFTIHLQPKNRKKFAFSILSNGVISMDSITTRNT